MGEKIIGEYNAVAFRLHPGAFGGDDAKVAEAVRSATREPCAAVLRQDFDYGMGSQFLMTLPDGNDGFLLRAAEALKEVQGLSHVQMRTQAGVTVAVPC